MVKLMFLFFISVTTFSLSSVIILKSRNDKREDTLFPFPRSAIQAYENENLKKLTEKYYSSQHDIKPREAFAQTDRDSFYNPNRVPPYLTNEVSGHWDRKSAIAALASQFDRTTSWVEINMGTSNSLTQIHWNLVGALFREL